jgi:hypothetical protein
VGIIFAQCAHGTITGSICLCDDEWVTDPMQNALSPVYCNMPRATYQSTINGGSGAGGGTSSGGSAVNTTTERPDSGVGTSHDAGERNPGKYYRILRSRGGLQGKAVATVASMSHSLYVPCPKRLVGLHEMAPRRHR